MRSLNSFYKLSVLSVVIGLLTACQIVPITDPRSPYYVAGVGSVVTIHKKIKVEAERTRVFLQFGSIVPQHEVNTYRVNCNFELNTLKTSSRHILPGRFVVTRVERHMNDVAGYSNSIQLAALEQSEPAGGMLPKLSLGMHEQSGSQLMFEEIRFSLKPVEPGQDHITQADVRELACRGALDYMSDMELPTATEIGIALGDFATLGEK